MSGPAYISPTDEAARVKHFYDAPVEYFEEILGIPAWTVYWSLLGCPFRGAPELIADSDEFKEWVHDEFYAQGIDGDIIMQSAPDPYARHVWHGDKDPLAQAVEAIARGARRTVLYGCTGSSKTYIALGATTAWYLDTHRPSGAMNAKGAKSGSTKVVGFAPTKDQLVKSWLSELRQHEPRMKELHPNLEFLSDTVYIDRDRWGLNWAAWAKAAAVAEGEDSATVAQGLHAENLLALFEEYPGIKYAVRNAILKTLSGKRNQLCIVGNPKFKGDKLEAMAKTPGVPSFHVSALDHPNFVTGIELIPGGVSRELEQDLLADAMREFGTDDPEEAKQSSNYTVGILGLWPDTSEDSYVKAPHLAAAEKGLKEPVFEFEHALPLEGFTRVFYEPEAQEREHFEGAAMHKYRYWAFQDIAGSDDITEATRGDKNPRDWHAFTIYDSVKKRIVAESHLRGPIDRVAQVSARLCNRFSLPYPRSREQSARGAKAWTGRAWVRWAWERQGVGSSYHTIHWGDPDQLPDYFDRYQTTVLGPDGELVPRTEAEIGPLEIPSVKKYRALYRKIIITKKKATETKVLGHDTNSSAAGGSRDKMLELFLHWCMTFRAYPTRMASRSLLREARTLVRIPPKKEGQQEKIKAQEGQQDDLIMSASGSMFIADMSAEIGRTAKAVARWSMDDVKAHQQELRRAVVERAQHRDAFGAQWKSSYSKR